MCFALQRRFTPGDLSARGPARTRLPDLAVGGEGQKTRRMSKLQELRESHCGKSRGNGAEHTRAAQERPRVRAAATVPRAFRCRIAHRFTCVRVRDRWRRGVRARAAGAQAGHAVHQDQYAQRAARRLVGIDWTGLLGGVLATTGRHQVLVSRPVRADARLTAEPMMSAPAACMRAQRDLTEPATRTQQDRGSTR